MDPFMIRAHVPEFSDWLACYESASSAALVRPDIEWLPSLRYGSDLAQEALVARPRGSPPRGGWPLHVFIHGGYWRMFEPRTFAYLVPAICSLGAVAVLLGYRKMPRHRLADLVADARAAFATALAAAPSLGADPSRVTASGHSAGAHLASFLAAAAPGKETPAIGPRRLLLLSGIYDVAPLRQSNMQAEIGLETEDLAWAPLALPPPEAEVAILVGARETAPFHEQARALAARWGAPLTIVEGQDHMSIVHALSVAGTPAHNALARTIE